MAKLLKALAVLSAVVAIGGLCVHAPALASAVTPLDTYPASGTPDGPDAGLFAAVYDGQEIALPFSVSASGRVVSIETGLTLRGGLRGWRIGVISYAALHDRTFQPGFYGDANSLGPWEGFADVATRLPEDCPNCTVPIIVEAGHFVSLSGLNWFLDSGDYFLVAAWRSDIEGAQWFTNASLLSDEWAIQAIGSTPYSSQRYPCGGSQTEAPWVTLAECGIAPKPTPVARITFEPGLRVPEPATLALVSVGLFGLVMTRRRRLASALQ